MRAMVERASTTMGPRENGSVGCPAKPDTVTTPSRFTVTSGAPSTRTAIAPVHLANSL